MGVMVHDGVMLELKKVKLTTMKKLLVLLTLFFVATATFSQPRTDTVFTKDYFLQKSRTQKHIGWGLLIGGTALAVYGLANSDAFDSSPNFGPGDPNDNDIDTEDVLLIGGVVADLTGVVFLVSSAKNKRKAEAAVSFGGQQLLLPQRGHLAVRTQPAARLRVGL